MMLNGIVIPKGSIITSIFSASLFFYILYSTLTVNIDVKKFGIVWIYLIYIAISIFLLSTNYFASYRMWIKYSNGLLCLPIAFTLITTEDDRKNVMKILCIFITLFILNYVLSNLLHLGGSRYGTESGIETGNLFDEALYLNVCALIMFPYIFTYLEKGRTLLLIAFAISVAITIVCFKRTIILCTIICLILYLYSYYRFNRKYPHIPFVGNILSQKHIIITIIGIIVLSISFAGVFMAQLDARADRIGAELSSETRVQELKMIIDDIIYNPSHSLFFFGRETFNTVGTYAGGSFGNRMIHENYGIMLNGCGIIGLTFYLIIVFYSLWLFFKYTKECDLSTNLKGRLLYISFLCLWIIFFIASFSGTIWLTIYPAINYILQGMILRYFFDYEK